MVEALPTDTVNLENREVAWLFLFKVLIAQSWKQTVSQQLREGLTQ